VKVLLLCSAVEGSYAEAHMRVYKAVFGEDAHTIFVDKNKSKGGIKESVELKSKNISEYDYVIGIGDSFFSLKFDSKKEVKSIFGDTPTIEFNNLPKATNKSDIIFYHIKSPSLVPNNYFVGQGLFTENLYVKEDRDFSRINVFVDHFYGKNQQDITDDILQYLEKIHNQYPVDVYFQNSYGITKNTFHRQNTLNNKYKTYPHERLSKYYRKTDIAFPTHRESMGCFCPEIALCGGVSYLKDYMYHSEIRKNFKHVIYNNLKGIDWDKIIKYNTLENKLKIREDAYKSFSLESYKKRIYQTLENIKK